MNRRLFIVAAILAALGCGTTTPITAADPIATPRTPARLSMQLTAPLQPLGVGTGHSAFPGLAKRPDGSIKLVWRQGSDHYIARDGALVEATSTNGGSTYTGVSTFRSGGTDYRDPSVSFIDGHEYITWFTGSNPAPAQGAFVSRDGGNPVRIDGLPYAAIAAPVVKLPDGRLGTAFYGRKAGEVTDTAWMAWSSDLGQTWTTNRIFNSTSIGLAHNEPWLVVDDTGALHMFARWGQADGIGVRSSMDSGVTWGPARKILSDATGRPTTIQSTNGQLVMVYRALPSKAAQLAYSNDRGQTWSVGPVLLTSPAGSPNGMTYAAMVTTQPGTVRLVVGMENADGSSVLYGSTLVEPTRLVR